MARGFLFFTKKKERLQSADPVRSSVSLRRKKWSLVFFCFLSTLILLSSLIDLRMTKKIRTFMTDMTAPVMEVVSIPLQYVIHGFKEIRVFFDTYDQNLYLQRENQLLRSKLEYLKSVEKDLEKILEVVKITPEKKDPLILSRVIAYPGRPFVKSIIINGGRAVGLSEDRPVLVPNGLVGRILEVGEWSSRVLLITDISSRVPVTIQGLNVDGILEGTNMEMVRLKYIPPKKVPKIGDRIETSGRGGIFPKGVLVGYISEVNGGEIWVTPSADLESLNYVVLGDLIENDLKEASQS